MPTIEYRRSRPEDRDAILEVLAEGSTARQIEARAALFDWQFGGRNPHDDGRPPFWVVTVDGAIGGVNGLMPVKIRYRGEPLLAVWSCETAVLTRHRGQGLGKGLLQRISAEAEVVLGYGISDMSEPILAKLGWEQGHDVRGLFFYVAEEGAKGLIKNARSSLVRLALGRTKADGIEVTTREDGVFDAEVDALWKASAPGYACIVERDAAYLAWRYGRHPRLRYVAYHARQRGRLAGVLVARPDATESVIADYCGPAGQPEIKAALVEAALADLSRRGTKRIRCETSEDDFVRVLARAGFRETRANFRFRVWSNRAGDRDRARGWLVMAGDSDNDLAAIGSGER
jgi:GNAT superfamily N-acetyltransferase